MLEQLLFSAYLIVFTLMVLFAGINYYRIRDKRKTNPEIVVFLIPFIINFCVAKYLFYQIDPLFTTLLPCLLVFFIGRRLKNVRIFGLTGGIATGKSTLVKEMRRNLPKLHVIDCDQITTQLRKKGNKGYDLIVKLLGEKSAEFIDNGTQEIDRQKLSKYVFQNPTFRRQLTGQMGKLIMWQIVKDIFKSIFSKQNLIMIDAPILYESKVLEHICFPIIVVGCSQEQQIQRLQKRNGYTELQALSRIKAQMPLALKQKKCDIYVKNEGTQQELLRNTLSKLNKLLQKQQKS